MKWQRRISVINDKDNNCSDPTLATLRRFNQQLLCDRNYIYNIYPYNYHRAINLIGIILALATSARAQYAQLGGHLHNEMSHCTIKWALKSSLEYLWVFQGSPPTQLMPLYSALLMCQFLRITQQTLQLAALHRTNISVNNSKKT